MNKQDKQYRMNQLSNVASFDNTYKATIKIITTQGETNYLSITHREQLKIIELLTGIKWEINTSTQEANPK